MTTDEKPTLRGLAQRYFDEDMSYAKQVELLRLVRGKKNFPRFLYALQMRVREIMDLERV